MPELRRDPVVGRWVIIARERGMRPITLTPVVRNGGASECPFCPGNEETTPPEVMAYRDANSLPNKSGWRLRVISNKFPALKIEGQLSREPAGIYDRMNGIGAHEVIIECPDHGRDLTEMSISEIRDVFRAYRDRMVDLERDQRFKYILIFKNHGEAAGASLEHAHSQLIAMPIVPKQVSEELIGAKTYYDFKERCIFCDIIRQEIIDTERLVSDYDSFISFMPFAPRFPFETHVIPKAHQSSFLEMSESDYLKLAACLRDTLQRLNAALNRPAFNFVLHTRPVSRDSHEYFHWHIEIIPKLTKIAGFEWGSGFFINHTAPEDAASYLRSLTLDPSVIATT